MAARTRWLLALAGAVGLHVPWWPLPRWDTRPPAERQAAAAPRPFTVRPTRPDRPATPLLPSALAPTRRRTARPVAPTSPPVSTLQAFMPPDDFDVDVRWTQGPREQTMRLRWHIEGRFYRLTLETSTAAPHHEAQRWTSEGSWDSTGLTPTRHTLKRPGRSEIAVSLLDMDGQRVAAFSTTTFTTPVAPTAQDALSWVIGWFAAPRPGPSHSLQLVHPEGRVVTLRFEPDEDDPLHWRGSPGGPAEDRLDVWLSATPPHRPERWRHTAPWGAPSEWQLMHQNDAGGRKPTLESVEMAPITSLEKASGPAPP